MADSSIENADFDETGYPYALSLIAGKHEPVIPYCLMGYEPVRSNEMQRYMKRVIDRTLSCNLKELEADGCIVRPMHPDVPPQVECTLTERGRSLVAVLGELCDRGEADRP